MEFQDKINEWISLSITGERYDIEHLQRASLKLSKVLDDIGVTKNIVAYRRRKYLLREAAVTATSAGKEPFTNMHHFGSQTEGTSTPEMGSDLDTLQYNDQVNVFQDIEDWVHGKFNMRMLADKHCAPRHCYLQVYDSDDPLPSTPIDAPSMVFDMTRGLLLQNTLYNPGDKEVFTEGDNILIKHGPSASNREDRDYVMAMIFRKLPIQCQAWFRRPRSSGWPSAKLLENCSQTGMFVLPVGHPESEMSAEEWRFSPSMIERKLMFDLNLVQLQTYVLLKLVKKTFVKPALGDHFTSFHCKTAVLFTVENTPQCLWTEENLLLGFLLCLCTLRRFLKHTYCPHFIVQNNLFIGKLPFNECEKVLSIVETIIRDPIVGVLGINADNLGNRMFLETMSHLRRYIQMECLPRLHVQIKQDLISSFVFRVIATFGDLMERVCHSGNGYALVSKQIEYYEQLLEKGSALEQMLAKIMLPKCHSLSMSLQLPVGCIDFETLLNVFSSSFGANISEQLKFASICYCTGHLDIALTCLNNVERMYTDQVYAVCECRKTESPAMKPHLMDILDLPENVFLSKFVAHCVQFAPLEAKNIPEHLVYEMRRSSPEDKLFRCHEVGRHDDWMDLVCVDSLPFLYYLQFLSFTALEDAEQQEKALGKLQAYLLREKIEHGHYETALNILGHCYQLKGQVEDALEVYNLSLEVFPRNNAASLFIAQLRSPEEMMKQILHNNPDLAQLLQTIQQHPEMLCSLKQLLHPA